MVEQALRSIVKRTQKDYSLAFKLSVIDEVESGKMTYAEAQNKFDIQGSSTVLIWLRKHGRLNWENKELMKERQTPHQRLRELEKKVKRLEIEKEILNKTIDIADDMLGTQIRKKFLPLLSKTSKQQSAPPEDMESN